MLKWRKHRLKNVPQKRRAAPLAMAPGDKTVAYPFDAIDAYHGTGDQSVTVAWGATKQEVIDERPGYDHSVSITQEVVENNRDNVRYCCKGTVGERVVKNVGLFVVGVRVPYFS